MTRTASGNFSERSISPDFIDQELDTGKDYRSDGSRRSSSRSYHHRNYESDYDEQHFSPPSTGSSGRHQQYDEYRRRSQQTSAALENRRRMFEREHQKQVEERRRVEHDFSDYSDVDYSRRHSQRRNRERDRERERERVAEYRRYFQQMSTPDDFSRTLKPSMRRQDSNTSQESSYYRRQGNYPEGQFEMYRSRFEVIKFRIFNYSNMFFKLCFFKIILNSLEQDEIRHQKSQFLVAEADRRQVWVHLLLPNRWTH